MKLHLLSKKIKILTTQIVLKTSVNSEVLTLTEKKIKDRLADGQDTDNNVIGTYSRFTQTISENYAFYGVAKSIKNKVFGEPYNLEWTGNFFKTIKAVYINSKIKIDAQSPFLEKRNKDKIIGLDEKSTQEVTKEIEKRAVRTILDTLA